MYTTIEQAKELVEVGLNPETSDMHYNEYIIDGKSTIDEYPQININSTKIVEFKHPCLSLNALLTVLQKANVWVCVQYLPITFDDNGKAINNVWDVECEYSYLSFIVRNENLFTAVYESVCRFIRIPDNNIVKPNKQ